MTKKAFTEYSKKSCVKNNLISLISFITITTLTIISLLVIPKIFPPSKEAFADLGQFIMILFLSFVVMIIASLVIPLFISIYKDFKDNIKSLVTLWLYNLTASIFIFALARFTMLPLVYFLLTMIGPLVILYFRYISIKKRVK